MTVFGITGATGQLGRLVVAQLKEKAPASSIVALVRSPEKAGALGVPARAADYTQPQALREALSGIDTLLLISSNDIGRRAQQHRNVVDAAKAAGVGRIVYTSILRADSSPLDLAPEHVDTEAAIRASGIPATILRNGWYMENHVGAAPSAVAAGAFIGSAGEGRIAGATREDYAAAAVAALLEPSHAGKTYELAGDEPYTLADLAREISRQAGKEVPYRNLAAADYAAALASAGVPAPFPQALAAWDVDASNGALFDEGRALSRLIGRRTTPLATAVTRSLRA